MLTGAPSVCPAPSQGPPAPLPTESLQIPSLASPGTHRAKECFIPELLLAQMETWMRVG